MTKGTASAARDDNFFERVHEVVARIPVGKVTTYGHIAEHVGRRGSARMVGYALNAAAGTDLPCHRVVNRFGALTGRQHFEGPYVMEERLRSEGISFTADACVILEEHLWIP
jgi:methylated-DNA-protein-cysteine methyltransferase related protein